MEKITQLTENAMNSIEAGSVVFQKGEPVNAIGLLIKGRVEAVADGGCVVLANGNFLGVWDVQNESHSFTYRAKDDIAVYILPVKGVKSVQDLLKIKPEYCGLLVTSLNFFIVELNKRREQIRKENETLCVFMKEKYEFCRELLAGSGRELPGLNLEEEVDSDRGVEGLEYYLQCARLPVDVQKKYYGASDYIAYYHYLEQCQLIRELIGECNRYGDLLYKYFRKLAMNENSLFQMVGRMALDQALQGNGSVKMDHIVDEIVEQINTTELFLLEKLGRDVQLDRDKMERLYVALMSGEAQVDDELEDMAAPEIEYLYNSLEQITEYAPVHFKVKAEFTNHVEIFASLGDKFARTPEVAALRKQISSEFFELYEAVLKKSFEDADIPLAVQLFLDYGFVSENLMEEKDLRTLLSLRFAGSKKEDGCRVFTMRQWLRAVYTGERTCSKSEFDLDYEATLRQMMREKKLTQQEMEQKLEDRDERLSFECQNLFRYADRVLNGNISAFVPVLCSEGIYNNIEAGFVDANKVNEAIEKIEKVDYSVFYRDRAISCEEVGVVKTTVIYRLAPDVIVFPIYGRNVLMWQDVAGRRRDNPGRILLPAILEKDITQELVRIIGYYRWEKCRTEMGSRWNDFHYPSLTSEYTDYLQFYRKNNELSQERRTKLRAQLQQYGNKHKEVFARDYMDWILRESEGAMRLNRVARRILYTYCPFSAKVRKALEGQTTYEEAGKRFIRANREANKLNANLVHKYQKEGLEVPKEIQDTGRYLNG